MDNINHFRINIRVSGDPGEGYVLYWMQIHRRLQYNYALDHAVAWSNRLKRPLVILEGLACDYPWATARTSVFILEGMAEHYRQLVQDKTITYIPYPEHQPGTYKQLVMDLCQHAAMLISDEYPVYLMRERNEQLENKLTIPFHTVDSNGIIPMALSKKAPYSAYIFRRMMQETFMECWARPPLENPLQALQDFGIPDLPEQVRSKRSEGCERLKSTGVLSAFVRSIETLDHSIRPVARSGTRTAALATLANFVANDLLAYGEERNNPDSERTSRLSPWLHMGKLSVFEVVENVLSMQPEDWDISQVRPKQGKRSGFFGGSASVEAYLDQVITWRETGFHFAWNRPDYDQFESLPGWALETLSDHADDPRDHLYHYEELAASKTHDPIWNAAQTQLREVGHIHGYLRMLWGKKVLEWTPDPQTALSYLIDLNNSYALDGRDPNSYSGIFWIFGRFDRAWGPERPVFGKVRYMSSNSARKKLALDHYLQRYSGSGA